MIKFSATNALVHSVSQVIEIECKSGGQPFYKRELIIDDSWDKDGRHFSNFVLIEFTGDKMERLDNIFPGQRVNIEGMLNGREYNGRIFNTVRGLSVSPYQPQQQETSPAPMPGGYPQQPPQAQYPQQPSAPMPGAYHRQPQYPQQQPAYRQQPTAYPQQQYPSTPAPSTPMHQQYAGPGVADLPFTPR